MKKKEILILASIVGVLIAVLLLLQGIRYFRHLQNQKNAPEYIVEVYLDNQVIASFYPDENKTIQVHGNYGEMTIAVENGEWCVQTVECPNHICEKMGWKTVDDIEPIVCVPNGINIIARTYGN